MWHCPNLKKYHLLICLKFFISSNTQTPNTILLFLIPKGLIPQGLVLVFFLLDTKRLIEHGNLTRLHNFCRERLMFGRPTDVFTGPCLRYHWQQT